MYKKAITALILLNLLFLAGYICVTGIEINRLGAERAFEMKMDPVYIADNKDCTMGILTVAASGQRVVNYGIMKKPPEIKPEKQIIYPLEEADYESLLRIVEAEASGEDEEGKLLVANVVLNRVKSSEFPNTVSEVVLQKSQGVTQFSPVASGRYYYVTISQETIDAVERALMGEDISQGALYFAARKKADSNRMKWFDKNLTFLFQHGGHEFFY